MWINMVLMAKCGANTMTTKMKVVVSYKCEYDRVRVNKISHNEASLASLDLIPLIPRWKAMDIQPHFVLLRWFVHNVNIVYLNYVVYLSCNICTTSKKGLVMKVHNIAIHHILHCKHNVMVLKELSGSS